MHERYQREAARLAKLSRPERFEELIEFPARHTFKVIGHSAGLSEALRLALDGLGFGSAIPVERPSARGRFVAITFEVHIDSGCQLDEVYTVLEHLPGVTHVF